MRPLKTLRLLTLLLLCAIVCGEAQAHSMYQSAVLIDYHSQSIDLELQMPPSKLSIVFGRPVTSSDLSDFQQLLSNYIQARIHVRSKTNQDCSVRLDGPISWTVVDGAPFVVAHFVVDPPAGTSVRNLTLEDDVITDSLPSHAVLVSVRSDWQSSTFANEPDLIGIINGDQRSLEIDRSSGNWGRGFASVFHLGVRHIAEGTDHLLFLLALLLPAALLADGKRWARPANVRGGFKQILKIVTAFTIGHSITLALAASGVVHVPGKPIEVLIAVSILISAIHATRPLFPGREAFIAASFGLIHGLAFASTLAELGLHRWERVASIMAFNLGIEAMQLLVVVCVMPSLMLLSRTTLYTPFRWIGALFAGVAAFGWILERTFSLSLPVDTVVDGLAKHSLLLVTALFVVSLAANRIQASHESREMV